MSNKLLSRRKSKRGKSRREISQRQIFGCVALTRNNNVLFNTRIHRKRNFHGKKLKPVPFRAISPRYQATRTIHNIPSLENTSSIPVFPRAPPLSLIIHSQRSCNETLSSLFHLSTERERKREGKVETQKGFSRTFSCVRERCLPSVDKFSTNRLQRN